MANHGHDRKTGRFITRAQRRTQAVQGLADLPDEEWVRDESNAILNAGKALAIERGWRPPPGVELEPQP